MMGKPKLRFLAHPHIPCEQRSVVSPQERDERETIWEISARRVTPTATKGFLVDTILTMGSVLQLVQNASLLLSVMSLWARRIFLVSAPLLDCEPSLHFAISGPGMEDSSVWLCGVMQVVECGESKNKGTAAVSYIVALIPSRHSVSD